MKTYRAAPFFRVDQLGGTTTLFLNTAHRFYMELYTGADSTPAVRAALEVLLFSIGDCMNSAPEQVRAMYDLELAEWSKTARLRAAAAEPKGLRMMTARWVTP